MFKFAAVGFAVSVWIANGSSGMFTLQDSLLAGYTYETLTGAGWLKCLQNCFTDARCLSYNYLKSQDEQANKCELNEKAFDNMCNAQKHVIFSSGWIYNQIKENVKTPRRGCGSCNRPTKPPGNVRGHNTSSTSILVQWDNISQADQNGIIKGYRVRYKALNTSGEQTSKIVNGSEHKGQTLEGLNEFTNYNICVLAFTLKGDGPMNCKVVMTAEDRPGKPPSNVRGRNTSSTSILVQWDDVSQADQNGIIKGYRVKYSIIDEGEISKQVNGSGTRETPLVGLNEFTNYSLCVLAFTVKGDGPESCILVVTAEDKPAAPPNSVNGHNTSSTSILVQWDKVPEADQNGNIRGYRVIYRHSTGGEEKAMVDVSSQKHILEGLEEFTSYNICVLAFTFKGDGPQRCVVVKTDGKEITANITCDNLCTVYADGKSLGDDNEYWYTVTKFTLPKGTKIIGIHGKDAGGAAALIGSFSNGMVTNSGWKCNKTDSTGWSTESFNDTAWPAAVEYGENGDAPWTTKVKHIASGAKWIWTKNNTNDDDVYCRIKV